MGRQPEVTAMALIGGQRSREPERDPADTEREKKGM